METIEEIYKFRKFAGAFMLVGKAAMPQAALVVSIMQRIGQLKAASLIEDKGH